MDALMSKGRAMDFNEYVEWLLAVIGAAIVGGLRYIYKSISLRPHIVEINARMAAIEGEISDLRLQVAKNTTRLEERKHET